MFYFTVTYVKCQLITLLWQFLEECKHAHDMTICSVLIHLNDVK